MDKDSRIYVAGHSGLVGSALTEILRKKEYTNLIFRLQSELDLTGQDAVDTFFSEQRPEYVFLAAAMVGGIVANNTYRADFIYQNIMIQSNIIHAAWKYKVKKLLFLGSTCIYPKNAPQPLKEEYLLSSPLENTNEPYAIAKIAGIKMCESFNIQYGTNFISVMPTNLYGPGDNYNLEKSHVLPALLRKIHLGKCIEDNNWEALRKDLDRNPIKGVSGSADDKSILTVLNQFGIHLSGSENHPDGSGGPGKSKIEVAITVWGTGVPLREFMYSKDMADACVYLMETVDISSIIEMQLSQAPTGTKPSHFLNIGTGEEISVMDLALKIRELTGFQGKIILDESKPDGPMRKATDVTILRRLGYRHANDLDSGLRSTYLHYKG